MEELNQFLNSVESSARRILKQQNKKQQELLIKERAALVRASKHGSTSSSSNGSTTSMSSGSPAKSAVSRDELNATYSPGGALIVQAPPTPTSPLKSPSRRSEFEDASPTYLPRLPRHATGESGKPPVAVVPPHSLPVIDHKKQAANDAAAEAARKLQRGKRAADKILNSPLYKSMAKSKADVPQGLGGASSTVQSIKKAIHEVDNVNLLLKRLGMRDGNGSPSSKRPDHAVEKRMCNACWASPDKVTGCEHHARILPSSSLTNNNLVSTLSDEAQLLRQMELQGPTSWLSDDLYVKFRSESDRESLWRAFCRLQDAEREREQRGEVVEDEVAVVPLVTRHPICDKYYAQVELENLQVQAATRRRNQTKTFVLDVNHIWLTNLDHFNERLVKAERRRQRRLARQRQTPDQEATTKQHGGSESGSDTGEDEEHNSLRDRRDEAAIRDGYSQIQSISTSRALQNALFPVMDPSTSSFALSRQGSMTVPTTPSTRRRKRPREPPPFKVAPLTLLVCGEWNPQDEMDTSSLMRVPGVALVGTQRVLWWSYPHDDPAVEHTKAVAAFARSKTLSSTNTILVKLTLAVDAPLLSPLWFAWCVGSKAPPPQLYEPPVPNPLPPQLVSHCLQSLLAMKLQTRMDTLLPGTIVILNAMSQGLDFTLELDEPYAHRRFWSEFQERDAFRQWWLCSRDSLPPNYDVAPQPCSVLVAQPNAPSVGGRFTWHALDAVRGHLNRPRREKDCVYIIENKQTCGSNGPLWFVVSMAHETMKAVTAAKLSSYLEMLEERRRQHDYEAKLVEIEQKIELGRLQLAAKRQEQKRIEQELSAKAARAADRFQTDPMGEQALVEWEQRLESSVVTNEQVGWQKREIVADQSHVVFYYALNEAMPRSHRFAWEKPSVWPEDDEEETGANLTLTSRSDRSIDSTDSRDDQEEEDEELSDEQRKTRDAIAQMASALLADEQFLRVLKAKLGLGEESDSNEKLKQRRTRIVTDEDDADEAMDAEQLDLRDHMIRVTEEQDRSKASLMATKMAKLQLRAMSSKLIPSKPGEGWKRLKVSKLPPNFARSVYGTHTEGPRSVFINQPNHSTPVGMIDPREASPYEPPEFIPELRVLLIPRANADLQEKKLQWAEYLATRPSTESSPQKPGTVSMAQSAKDALFDKDPAEREMSMEQLVAKAVLCARNNNLQGLEDALDGGCEVNARDNHGNTLFILVCQQGNKKIAKFLMRRHADMNLQNLNGNTALHYLVEYKHSELAEYVKSKGAIDTIQNAAGLTCYEGLSMEQANAL